MEKQNRKFQCLVKMGNRGNRLWVKSAEYVGNSVVIDLSPEPCFVSQELCLAAKDILFCAAKRPFKKFSVTYSEITDLDFVASSEEVSGDE